VDVGRGWLIFGLPPSEIAVHPSETAGSHELYFLSDDIEAFVATMSSKGIACSPLQNQRWGVLTQLTLPGGGTLGVYQPSHARPEPMLVSQPAAKVPRARKRTRRRAVRKVAARTGKKRSR
jgi:hypothetical protein